ncbi:hypothetical protein HanXRQr2_Chr08g0344671 [Helianthus annuus]|uniref:Uncharacterized protein n=1 Tax=Helianthus annuus TaxID=4232 RepID=A0A251U814_HELAN|nr:hypothetical protein HanXRQr2_Chr08g0344671 [Helianthus annuus]KAJ0902109.1 hypothetical protein HanPSC8_Chr08g0333181 [Helianthus annuus]
MASFTLASRSDTISVDPTPDLLIFRLVVGSSTMVLVGGRSGQIYACGCTLFFVSRFLGFIYKSRVYLQDFLIFV